ncbi:helix-turn-helix domain-containing protein [Micromonospora sp. CA-248212]|uniref:helix-turn-helix domain-containing protein n=1 Tax=Micromonospora sp. CA-248212 TaxID=3239961 RepID=UPI003D8AD999
MARTDYIGLRVARWRDIAGLTQEQLAERVGYSNAYISMIENGQRIVTKRSLLIALATALGVSVNDLTGQPERPRSRDDLAVYSAVPLLRGALDDDPDSADPVNVDQLTADVDRAMRARMMCDYPTLARILPGVLAESRRLSDGGDPTGLALFVRAAVCGALAIKPFGYVDLAARLSERAEHAARMLERPAELAAARFAAAQTALASGTVGGQHRSLRTASAAAVEVGDSGGDDTTAWYGMLHLHAALSAASIGRVGDVATHLGEARAAAGRVASDPWRMEFTPANVGVWQVGVAVENGEPERAPEHARHVDRSQLRTANRLVRLHIDAGRGHYAAGDHDRAVRQFLAADEVSAPELRSRTTVREIVAQLVRDARRGGSDELRDLAVRVGVDPLDPDHALT